jgi:hypothetical protein
MSSVLEELIGCSPFLVDCINVVDLDLGKELSKIPPLVACVG